MGRSNHQLSNRWSYRKLKFGVLVQKPVSVKRNEGRPETIKGPYLFTVFLTGSHRKKKFGTLEENSSSNEAHITHRTQHLQMVDLITDFRTATRLAVGLLESWKDFYLQRGGYQND